MSENKKFSLGGFPPIYEIVTGIKNKGFTSAPSSILSIQSILARKNMRPIVDMSRNKTYQNNKRAEVKLNRLPSISKFNE
jgi:hypothetical protein